MSISNPVIIAALAALRGRDGLILPQDVVKAARKPSSPLHDQFEWDDSEAAERYRIDQARQLLRVVITMLPGTTKEVRAFVSLSTETGYREIGAVLVNVDQRAQMLEDARREMARFIEKYQHLVELADVIRALRAG